MKEVIKKYGFTILMQAIIAIVVLSLWGLEGYKIWMALAAIEAIVMLILSVRIKENLRSKSFAAAAVLVLSVPVSVVFGAMQDPGFKAIAGYLDKHNVIVVRACQDNSLIRQVIEGQSNITSSDPACVKPSKGEAVREAGAIRAEFPSSIWYILVMLLLSSVGRYLWPIAVDSVYEQE